MRGALSRTGGGDRLRSELLREEETKAFSEENPHLVYVRALREHKAYGRVQELPTSAPPLCGA